MQPLREYKVNFEYHRKIQGFVYSLLQNTKFDQVHDKAGFKFFCFSNIYKAKNTNHHCLIISSPNPNFITQVEYQLNKIIENQIPLEIGIEFDLVKVIRIPERNFKFPLEVITQSPIIIRIPIEKYHGKITNLTPYKSVLWRAGHPINLFVESLETNLKKKYAQFTERNFRGRIFESFDFTKQVSTKIHVGKSRVPIIGSLWRLGFSDDVPIDFQLFALDCGMGERNSLGFGFINPLNKY